MAPTVYVIKTRVLEVEEKRRVVGHYATGQVDVSGKKEYAPREEKLGWFVRFEASWESLYVGREPPTTSSGELVKVGTPAKIAITFGE